MLNPTTVARNAASVGAMSGIRCNSGLILFNCGMLTLSRGAASQAAASRLVGTFGYRGSVNLFARFAMSYLTVACFNCCVALAFAAALT